MEKINNIILKKKISPSIGGRKINVNWEIAKEFASFVGLNEKKDVPFVLMLFRIYGQQKVLNTKSYFGDYPDNGQFKTRNGLIRWKLEQDKNGN